MNVMPLQTTPPSYFYFPSFISNMADVRTFFVLNDANAASFRRPGIMHGNRSSKEICYFNEAFFFFF
jgi:hypothetical protein